MTSKSMFDDAEVLRCEAEDLCCLLQATGLSFVVAGGGARDTALGVMPKDFDIVVFGWGNNTEQVAKRLDSLDGLLSDYANEQGMAYTYLPSYHDAAEGGDFGSRLFGVYKIGRLDVIISRCGTWSQVLAEFDFNLNQFYFPSSIPRYSGQYSRDPKDYMAYPYNPTLSADDVQWYPALSHPLSTYAELLSLKTVRADASTGRTAYIQAKHKQLLPAIAKYVSSKTGV